MKTNIFLYPGNGIGPELFESLQTFFHLFDDIIELHYLNSFQDLWGLNKPYSVLCGPFESQNQQTEAFLALKPFYALTHIPHEARDATRILAVPILENQMLTGVLKDSSVMKSCFKLDERIVMVQQYQEQPQIWENTMKAWTKLAFTNYQSRFEDANIVSFIKHGKYKNSNQIVTSFEGANVLNALYASVYNALNRSHTKIQVDGGSIYVPLHGHAPDIVGMGIANPYALLMAFCNLLSDIGHVNLSQRIENQIVNAYYENRSQTTPDQRVVLNTEKYMSMLIDYINL